MFVQIFIKTDKVDKAIQDFNSSAKTKVSYVDFLLKAISLFNGEGDKSTNTVTSIQAGVQVVPEDIGVSLVTNMKTEEFSFVVLKGLKFLAIGEISQMVQFHKGNKEKITTIKGLDWLKYVPNYLIDMYFSVLGFVSYDLGLRIPFLGIEKHRYGEVLVYDFSGEEVQDVSFPCPQVTRTSMTFTLCAPAEKVLVDEKDQLYVGKEMILNLNLDSRTCYGKQVGEIQRVVEQVFDNPKKYM